MIGVHRVILSAITPYFHAIFLESLELMVHLDNITQRSLDYLIAYIYSGKVEVECRDLKDFLRSAKFLRIQGIDDIDINSELNNSLPIPSNPIPNQRADNREICDVEVKCKTTKYDDRNNINSNECHDVEEENLMDSNDTESFDDTFEDDTWTPDSDESFSHDEEEEMEKVESYCTCDCPCPDETNINNEQNQSVCADITCHVRRFNKANEELDFPPSKRARIDSSEFNIIADIRVSPTNFENLFYNGSKFSKRRTLKSGSISWLCSGQQYNCRASAQTKMIDGVMMMKVIRAGTYTSSSKYD